MKGDLNSRQEAVKAVVNLTTHKCLPQIEILVMSGAIKPMCDLLVHERKEMVNDLLRGLVNILDAGTQHVQKLIKGCGGLEKLKTLVEKEQHKQAKGPILKTLFAVVDCCIKM